MKALRLLVRWWDSHGTGILGFLASFCAGAVLIPDLISQAHKPYWAAANLALGLLTMNRSNTNRKKLEKDMFRNSNLPLVVALAILGTLGFACIEKANAQTAATRVTPCSATTQNNEICLAWTHDGKTVAGDAISGTTFRVEQKFGTGAYVAIATSLANKQLKVSNLAPGPYTFRVFANCSAAECIESVASNEAAKSATANPVQPSAPVLIIAATIRADGPPTYRIVYTVRPREGEIVFVAPDSMRPVFANR